MGSARVPKSRLRGHSLGKRAFFACGSLAALLGLLAARRLHADTAAPRAIARVATTENPATSAPTPTPSPLPASGAAPSEPAARPPVSPPNYTLVDAGWDRPIRVLPAVSESKRAIVYLHGYCGDVNAVGAFVPAAAAHGTLIALLGDQPCPDKPGRFKWSRDIRGLDERIRRAIRLVNRAQKLELDANDLTLFGYSQGALRAESLARFYGKHYPRVILGGPPERPKPPHFSRVRTVAVFGGELEDTADMVGGAADLVAAGQRARFFLLPGVDHGDFGGELAGNRSLREVLDFVDPPPSPVPSVAPETAETSETATAK
jgi:predicted esterase